MSSSWPIVLGMLAVVFAAFWYDASVASAKDSAAAAHARTAQVP
jgi:hypothetical protein